MSDDVPSAKGFAGWLIDQLGLPRPSSFDGDSPEPEAVCTPPGGPASLPRDEEGAPWEQ